jgi:hypothetical protein
MHPRIPVLAAALLAGCATQPVKAPSPAPAYAAPTSGPTARLLVRVNHSGGRYTVSSFAQPVSCSQRQEFVSASVREPERQAFTLGANRLQTLSYMQQPNDRQACQVIVSFEPRAGKTYLMRNTADAQGCGVELVDASDLEHPALERSRMVRERIGFGLNDNACKPILSTSVPVPTGAAAAQAPGSRAKDDSLAPFRDLLPRR